GGGTSGGEVDRLELRRLPGRRVRRPDEQKERVLGPMCVALGPQRIPRDGGAPGGRAPRRPRSHERGDGVAARGEERTRGTAEIAGGAGDEDALDDAHASHPTEPRPRVDGWRRRLRYARGPW